jgi:hypothetical protein
MDHPLTKSDCSDLIHRFGDKSETKTGLPVGLDGVAGRHDHSGVLHRVIKIISLDHQSFLISYDFMGKRSKDAFRTKQSAI